MDLRKLENCIQVTKDCAHVYNLAADMGEPNRGTLEYGKAGTRINRYQPNDSNLLKRNVMFQLLSFCQLRACKVSLVAVSGVFV